MLYSMNSQNVMQFESGERIFKEGERGELMYILLKGAVDLKMKVEGGETVLKTVDTANEFFGEMALLDDRPRSASAVATRLTQVLAVDQSTFENMILTNGKFALKIIKVLAERIRRSNDQVSDLIETGPRERIARSMVDFALNHGDRIHDGSLKVNLEAMKLWINNHIGVPLDEVEAAVFRLIKMETIAWAATSVKTRECVNLPEAFVRQYDRRNQN